jgi:hypothetical protein
LLVANNKKNIEKKAWPTQRTQWEMLVSCSNKENMVKNVWPTQKAWWGVPMNCTDKKSKVKTTQPKQRAQWGGPKKQFSFPLSGWDYPQYNICNNCESFIDKIIISLRTMHSQLQFFWFITIPIFENKSIK